MKKIIFFTLLITSMILNSKIVNLSTYSKGLSLTFDISGRLESRDVNIDGKTYKKFILPDEFILEGYVPETEYYSTSYYFSAPMNSSPELSYNSLQSEDIMKKDLVPAQSFLQGQDGILSSYYKETGQREDAERSAVTIDYIGRVDDHNLYKLTYYPLVFSKNKARMISEIDVNIKFNTPFVNTPSKKILPANDFEEKILNLSFSKINPYKKNKVLTEVFLDKPTEWIKIKIGSEGIYKVTGRMITDKGLDISSTLSSRIKVYSSAGEDLSNNPADSMYHGALEIACEINDADNDGMFESNDYIEFYALGTNSWKRGNELEHYYNKYSDHSYYWIDLGTGEVDEGKRVKELKNNEAVYTDINSFIRPYFFDNRDQLLYTDYKHHWYTRCIYPLETATYQFPVKNIDPSGSVTVKLLHANVYPGYASMKYTVNNDPTTEYSSTSIDFQYTLPADKFLADQTNTLKMSNLTEDYKKYLYSYEVHYNGSVTADTENEYFVSDLILGQNYRFNLGQANGKKLFDVTDPLNVRVSTLDSDQCILAPVDQLNHYFLWNGIYKTPVNLEVLDYSNGRTTLHSINDNFDMVIISPDEFYDHYNNDNGGLIQAHLNAKDKVNSIKVVNIKDVNNEFGRGYQEPSATRNFIKYASENWGSEFILIGADGNYDFKGILNLSEKNFIFPSDVEFGASGGFNRAAGSDDFYANLNSLTPSTPNVSIGRFAVRNLTELENIIEKTVSHINNNNLGNMNTRMLLAVDDERNPDRSTWRETDHIDNTEDIIVPVVPDNIFADKLYLTEFPFEFSPSTGLYLKPRAADELLRKLHEGVNLFIYVGHGAPTQMAHEKLLTSSNYSLLDNYNRYFFQIGATCSFGVFNDPYTRSLSERMLTDRNKGSIGLINAVSAVTIGSNENLVSRILKKTFEDQNNKLTIGEALKKGKLEYISDNSGAYMLLGDPALKLFKDKKVIQAPDSVRLVTLKLDTISTTLIIPDSLDIQSTSGILNTMIIDSERDIRYFNEEHWDSDVDSTLNYTLPGKVILSALSSINFGQSNTEFILPKDLTYGENKGKILYYAYNSDKDEFSGFTGNVSIVGESAEAVIDTIPPKLNVLYNSLNYVPGDPIDPNTIFYVRISDENGVNTSGGIGHKMMMEVDGDVIELNEFFQYDLDTYKSGYTKYQLFNLSAGKHLVKASAWDTSNNYNEVIDEFIVTNAKDTTSAWIGNLLNYPNPVKNNGTTFGFTTYGTTSIDSYTITVYTVNGRKIKSLKDCPVNYSDSFQYCEWDGKDDDGDIPGNGVYIYILRLKFHGGKTIMKKGKLIFAR
ncbi:MAG: type IX secretion system sortase PorU [Candidatus Delongbacteria bacterium]|nr:type IX secretion system sortase PorU [Candidatus Delongbacteria bacterium]